MPRQARIVLAGYPHHIVQRGNNSQNIFFEDSEKKYYLGLMDRFSKETHCIIHAYCLMSNHIHILLTPEYPLSLAKLMQKINLRYTQYINKKYDRTGSLWEGRYFSSLVDKEKYLWAAARYIERNPVEAGIVEKVIDYYWSSAQYNTLGRSIRNLNPIWSNEKERKEYINFVNKKISEEQIQFIEKSFRTGKVLGGQDFKKFVSKKLGI